jgi:hypothetical protein
VAKYETNEEKESFINDILKLKGYKIMNLSKEYDGKGKGLYKKIYIDLINK